MSVAAPPPVDRPFVPERAPFLWLVEREIVRYLRIWRFSILGQVLSALLFVVVFARALSGQVGAIGGVPYGRFILPGLVVQAVVTVGFVNGTTSLFEARSDRYIHGVLASPLRWWEIDLALTLGAIVREAIVAIGLLLVAVPLAGAELRQPAVAALTALLLLVASAQLGVIAGAYARSLDDVYTIETLIVLPLGFLSGAFYAVQTLPGVWHVLTEANPVFYFVQAARFASLGHADVSPWTSLPVCAAIAIALTAWSLALFRSAATLKP